MPSFKAVVGGELKGLTKQLQQSRDEAMQRMVEGAMARGANAVLAMRFDANEVASGYQEIVAYGTAVVIVQAVDARTGRPPWSVTARRSSGAQAFLRYARRASGMNTTTRPRHHSSV